MEGEFCRVKMIKSKKAHYIFLHKINFYPNSDKNYANVLLLNFAIYYILAYKNEISTNKLVIK